MSELAKPGLIYAKMAKIMGEIGAIAKTGDNKAQGYKFRKIEDVYAGVQKVLAENGVFSTPTVLSSRSEERPSKSGGVSIWRLLEVKYTYYACDGSSVDSVVPGEGMDSGDKASNKAMSAAHKYELCQTFCIPTQDLLIDSEDDSQDSKDNHGPSGTVIKVPETNKSYNDLPPVNTPPPSQPKTTSVAGALKKPFTPRAGVLLKKGNVEFLERAITFQKNYSKEEVLDFVFGYWGAQDFYALDQVQGNQLQDWLKAGSLPTSKTPPPDFEIPFP